MLIIFDCDGVLVDSEILAARELQHYLEDIAFPVIITEDTHTQFLGLTLKRIQEILETAAGCPLPNDFQAELRRRDRIAFKRDLQAIPGIHQTLPLINYPKCVASSGTQEKVRDSLSITGLLEFFMPHVFSASDPEVKHGKPAPDLFKNAAKIMGFHPAQCIVVEDSIAGVEAGVAASMFTIGFIGGGHCSIGHGDKLRSAGAHEIIEHIGMLPSIIKKCEKLN